MPKYTERETNRLEAMFYELLGKARPGFPTKGRWDSWVATGTQPRLFKTYHQLIGTMYFDPRKLRSILYELSQGTNKIQPDDRKGIFLKLLTFKSDPLKCGKLWLYPAGTTPDAFANDMDRAIAEMLRGERLEKMFSQLAPRLPRKKLRSIERKYEKYFRYLTDRQRKCLTLHLERGMKPTAIANHLGIDRSTVRDHITAAIKRINKCKMPPGNRA